MTRQAGLLCLAALFWLLAVPVWAQEQSRSSIMPPRPPAPSPMTRDFKLEKIGLEAVADGQKIQCTLKYVLYNPGSRDIEVDFLAPLPEGGTVTGLTLMNGQTEMPGQVYTKDEAWAIYRDIVAKRRDPALLEYAGHNTFRARVFPVPPGQRQTLELNFDYLAPKSDGQVSLNFPLAGPLTLGQTPEQDIQVRFKDQPGLGGFYSPLPGVKIEHQKSREALATLTSGPGPALDYFRLHYQTDSGPMGGLILSHKPNKDEDGFFLLMADPDLPVGEAGKTAKNVVFALDKSGSMNGPKFQQAKEALEFVLERLEPKDSFGLVDYNGNVSAWKSELAEMTPENRRSAQDYVRNLRSGGSTNIEKALETSFELFQASDQPNYIVFLTDGRPTSGQTNEIKLAEAAKGFNKKGARLFVFGVGHDVNARLLDRLSGQAGGFSIFVEPEENLETKVSSFFTRLTTPALVKPTLAVSRPVNRVLPETPPDLFVGQQMVLVGRYPKGGPATLTLSGRQGGKVKKYEFKADLAEGPTLDGQFIASLWAQRRIGELIDQIDLEGGQPNPELVEELVQLSKQYGILTPYTSFLALEDQPLTNSAALAPMAARNLSIMSETVGAGANAQRAYKGEMKQAAAPAKVAGTSAADRQRLQDMAQMDLSVQNMTLNSGGVSLDAGAPQSPGSGAALSPPNQWAGRTFFLKSGRWQAEDLTDDDLKNLKSIKQLSEEYYALAQALKPEEMIWLIQTEPVAFKHQGISYLIEPAD